MKRASFESYGGVLRTSVVFKDLPDAELQRIASLGFILEAGKDDVILYENVKGGVGIYVIATGLVEVLQLGDQERVLGTLVPGDCLGEYSLIDGRETSASARALEDSRLFFLPRGAFQQAIEANPSVAAIVYRNLLIYLIGRLRQKNEG